MIRLGLLTLISALLICSAAAQLKVDVALVNVVATVWRSIGLAPRVLDFEAWVDVTEERLLEIADSHRLTRPRRQRNPQLNSRR